jgi:sugar lactone lactonase YvrE
VLAQGLQAPRLLRLDRAAAVVVTRAASGEPDHVIRIDRHGGGAVDLGAAESPLADLALGAGVVWWSEPQAHALVAVPLAGGVEPTRLTVAGRPVLVATDGERLVWVCEDGEMGFRGEDRSIRDLGRVGGEPRALVLTETEAFVNLVDGRIVRVALAAKIETVAKHQAVGGGFRRWGGDLYYFDSEAREVRRLDLVSFAVTTVAAPGDGDFTIAPARRHVYLADSAQGLVRRTPRETAGSSELVAQTQGAPSEIEMWGDWMVWIDEGSGDLVDLGR